MRTTSQAPGEDPAGTSRGRRLPGGRRTWIALLVVLVVLAVVVTLLVRRDGGLSGAVEAVEGGSPSASPAPRPVTVATLLGVTDAQEVAPRQRWRLVGTTDNTRGTGINTVCQQSRFADPEGEGTFVRSFATTNAPRRTLLQTVEISASEKAAGAAYDTTLGWFAGCREARLQLQGTYRLDGLGDEAQLLRLRLPDARRPAQTRSLVVGVVRTGALTVSTVAVTRGGDSVRNAAAARVLTSAVTGLCETDPAGECPGEVRATPVLPPRSGEALGTLAAADLPVVGRINRPWVGTRPVPARPNPSSTTCDRADFVRAGAPRARTRTFLVPGARVDERFGVSQTYGRFPTVARAQRLVDRIEAAMARCEKDDLSAEVSAAQVDRPGPRGSVSSSWRLDSEVREDETVGYWMGVARVGRWVTQVLLTPVEGADVDSATFEALVVRARDRLFGLTGPRR
ncbi:hypothetical protein [Nocardioides aurantiacus]|uniref:Uncharacterized protein n=1 Tax=Nocardioides aurantiacus TaxID=86796 RepID=A0A3N2CRK6_9ACTN|nr:hypothetical protein [Nocardioides aurantiacus]ROR90165.1 hypothetical protein EDD33_1000 [Nocardioides aurantiacus]